MRQDESWRHPSTTRKPHVRHPSLPPALAGHRRLPAPVLARGGRRSRPAEPGRHHRPGRLALGLRRHGIRHRRDRRRRPGHGGIRRGRRRRGRCTRRAGGRGRPTTGLFLVRHQPAPHRLEHAAAVGRRRRRLPRGGRLDPAAHQRAPSSRRRPGGPGRGRRPRRRRPRRGRLARRRTGSGGGRTQRLRRRHARPGCLAPASARPKRCRRTPAAPRRQRRRRPPCLAHFAPASVAGSAGAGPDPHPGRPRGHALPGGLWRGCIAHRPARLGRARHRARGRAGQALRAPGPQVRRGAGHAATPAVPGRRADPRLSRRRPRPPGPGRRAPPPAQPDAGRRIAGRLWLER
ncbi:Uncharacterised protein [Achromobacter dolens]|nr:Uncharacterised protein [Achromobacter dolens]